MERSMDRFNPAVGTGRDASSSGESIDPKYRLGIPEMDAQHARWIDLIEKFRAVGSSHLMERAGINAAIRALEQLLKYTQSHFASEEQFIAAHNYPDLESHKRQHSELETVLAKLLDEAHAHPTGGTPLKLNLFATVWLLEHIMQEDDKYARFILGKPSL
jgi:hemerythrin